VRRREISARFCNCFRADPQHQAAQHHSRLDGHQSAKKAQSRPRKRLDDIVGASRSDLMIGFRRRCHRDDFSIDEFEAIHCSGSSRIQRRSSWFAQPSGFPSTALTSIIAEAPKHLGPRFDGQTDDVAVAALDALDRVKAIVLDGVSAGLVERVAVAM